MYGILSQGQSDVQNCVHLRIVNHPISALYLQHKNLDFKHTHTQFNNRPNGYFQLGLELNNN